jgi:hypothetical protein
MSKVTVVYRIISYILVVFAGLLGLVDVLMLLASLVNPAGLISVAMVTATVVYSFTSFYFGLRAIQYNRRCKPSLQIWIRVTAIITVLFAVQGLISSIALVANPDLLNDAYKDAVKMQPSLKSSGVSKDELIHAFKIGMYICEVYFLMLLLHITITFGLLRQYKHLFNPEDQLFSKDNKEGEDEL